MSRQWEFYRIELLCLQVAWTPIPTATKYEIEITTQGGEGETAPVLLTVSNTLVRKKNLQAETRSRWTSMRMQNISTARAHESETPNHALSHECIKICATSMHAHARTRFAMTFMLPFLQLRN